MIGEKVKIDGKVWYKPDYCSADGVDYGYVFKDEVAFHCYPDVVCYIPESEFDDADVRVVNGFEFSLVGGYTRKDLESLLEGKTDEVGEPINIEDFFNSLYWCNPETRLNEILDF